jgi:hypothetical protein
VRVRDPSGCSLVVGSGHTEFALHKPVLEAFSMRMHRLSQRGEPSHELDIAVLGAVMDGSRGMRRRTDSSEEQPR